jgi:putative heme-binding domain-containing protein
VAERAIEAIDVAASDDVIEPIRRLLADRGSSATARRSAVRALSRLNSHAARDLEATLLSPLRLPGRAQDPMLARIVMQGWGRRAHLHDRMNSPRQFELLRRAEPRLRRLLIEAIGRSFAREGYPKNPDLTESRRREEYARAMLDVASESGDRALEHAALNACLEGFLTPNPLDSSNPHPNRNAALLVRSQLHRMPGGPTQPIVAFEEVRPLLLGSEEPLRSLALGVAEERPEWEAPLADQLARGLTSVTDAPPAMALRSVLARFATRPRIRAMLDRLFQDERSPKERTLLLFESIAESDLKALPAEWWPALRRGLADADAETRRLALAVIRRAPPTGTALGELRREAEQRIVAGDPTGMALPLLTCGAGGVDRPSATTVAFLKSRLAPERTSEERGMAARILADATLSPSDRLALAGLLATAGPSELDTLLSGFERGGDEATGLAALAALERSKVFASRPSTGFAEKFAKYPTAVRQRATALEAKLARSDAERAKRIDDVLRSIAGKGDVRRGQAVFNGQKAACLGCHAVGYVGGKVGPDLTRIGSIRTERDLLEAILYPSASIVRSYEPSIVTMADGRILTGLVTREASDEVTLVVNATQTLRLPRADIEGVKPGTISVMPTGLDKILSERELADLIAFLRDRR